MVSFKLRAIKLSNCTSGFFSFLFYSRCIFFVFFSKSKKMKQDFNCTAGFFSFLFYSRCFFFLFFSKSKKMKQDLVKIPYNLAKSYGKCKYVIGNKGHIKNIEISFRAYHFLSSFIVV